MLRSTFKSWTKVIYFIPRYIYKNVASPESSKKIFLVIPEMADNINFINIDNIRSVSPYDVFIEVSKSIQKFDSDISILSENINNYRTNKIYDFDNTILEINKILEDIDVKFKFLKGILISSDDQITQLIIYCLFNKIHLASQQLLNVSNLDIIINDLLNKELNNAQRKIVEMMKNNFEMFGRYLPKDKMNAMTYNIDAILNHQMRFNISVSKSKSKIQQYIDRSDFSDDTPKWLLSKLKVSEMENKYKFDMNSSYLIQDFLKYCTNPLIRNQVWLSSRQIGGKIIFNFKSSNYKTITEIRNYRRYIANIFGEDNYVNFIFRTKSRMAKSLDDVMNLLELYKSRVLPMAEIEFKDLNEYAMKEKGLQKSLMPWDIDYIHHSYSRDILNCSWSKLEIEDRQFDLQVILEKIFSILHKMFNLSFTNKHTNEDEIAYIISTKEYIGEIIFKVNLNSAKKFIDIVPLKVKSGDSFIKVSYIIINLPLDNPNLFNCLEIIGNLGTILGYHLSKNEFDISPLHTGLPPDAINVSSKFLLHSFLSSTNVLGYIFSELDKETVQNLCDSYETMGIDMETNISCLESLYRAYFDIEMWISDKSLQNIQMELWHDFFGSSTQSKLYFPLQKMDEWPCSSTDIFSDQLWGGVKKYSLFWTDNIVKKLFKEFYKAKFNDWNPTDDISPELFSLFNNFQKMFIEETNSVRQFPI